MITITHTRAEGTLIDGSRKGDGVWEILKGLRDNWRSFHSIGRLGIGQSRDKAAQTWKIDRAAKALRDAGYNVTVTIDESDRRTFAEAESDRYDRAEGRAERMTTHAENAAARSESAHARAHRIAESIPFGQPVLVGHHSEGRHRRDLDRIHNLHGKGFEEGRKADHFAHRAQNAEAEQASRENVPATLRRIAKLEADERKVKSDLVGRLAYVDNGQGGHKFALVKPDGDDLARLTARAADIADELSYWRAHIAKREAEGVKVWGPPDFTKGDYALHRGQWFEVARVNPKSVSVPWSVNLASRPVVHRSDARHTRPIPYDEVQGRKSAEEMAAMLAEATTA